MGHSLEPIPDLLRYGHAKDGFILWLNSLPIDPRAKRALISTWTQHTHHPFTSVDYLAAGLSPSGDKG